MMYAARAQLAGVVMALIAKALADPWVIRIPAAPTVSR